VKTVRRKAGANARALKGSQPILGVFADSDPKDDDTIGSRIG
jgi:hypothetical protein